MFCRPIMFSSIDPSTLSQLRPLRFTAVTDALFPHRNFDRPRNRLRPDAAGLGPHLPLPSAGRRRVQALLISQPLKNRDGSSEGREQRRGDICTIASRPDSFRPRNLFASDCSSKSFLLPPIFRSIDGLKT